MEPLCGFRGYLYDATTGETLDLGALVEPGTTLSLPPEVSAAVNTCVYFFLAPYTALRALSPFTWHGQYLPRYAHVIGSGDHTPFYDPVTFKDVVHTTTVTLDRYMDGEYTINDCQYRFKDGFMDGGDRPAFEGNGYKLYARQGIVHNEHGPAEIHPDGTELYFLDGNVVDKLPDSGTSTKQARRRSARLRQRTGIAA